MSSESSSPGQEEPEGASWPEAFPDQQAARPRFRDLEPFVTIRAYPRRFGWGIPLVFLVSFVLGVALVDVNFSLAIAVQLFIQTVGLLWLYVPAARDLREKERAEWERQQAGDDESVTRR